MDRDTIIDGLRMTMDLFTFDPTTGEEKDPDDLNDLDRATYDACKGALEILERLNTDSDTISRQAALDALRAMQTYKLFAGDDMLLIDQAGAQTELMVLPPAQPERIKGHWIEIALSNHTYKCSVCGRLLVNITDGKNNVAKNYPYCHCGADMRGGGW